MPTVDYVLAVLRTVAGDKSVISCDTDLLVDVDIDSLALLEILETLEKHFQVPLLDRMPDFSTISSASKLAAFIDETRGISKSI
jgi:acyl carrier protein